MLVWQHVIAPQPKPRPWSDETPRRGWYRGTAEALAVTHCYLFEASLLLLEVQVRMSQSVLMTLL